METQLANSDRRQTEKLESFLLSRIQSGCEDAPHKMNHVFSPGIYWREIEMYAGTVLVGREHTTTHLNVVLTGKAEVLIEGESHLIDATKAPVIFESKAGVRKTLHIIEDMRWATIHPNPNDIQDIEQLEMILSVPSPCEIEHRNRMKQIKEEEAACLFG